MDYRYRLERYQPGGANRYQCPKCGRKKCFTRYVDNETGKYIDETCGRCNHESSCQYDYPPAEFFRDHPERRQGEPWERTYYNGRVSILGHKRWQTPVAPPEFKQTEFFDISWAEKGCERQSTFRTWFEQLPFDQERIQQVLREYYVGGSQKDVVVNGTNHGPAAVFWMIDEQQRVHDAKLIAYTPNGHRVQGWSNWMRSICEKTKMGPQLQQTEKLLFGLHLLTRYPEKMVCIVESEKSALICACQYPEHLWLATGGCGNLQPAKLRPLMQRKLMIFPDSGEYRKWSDQMLISGHKQYVMIDELEGYEPNTDIADIILGEARLLPPL